MKVTIAINLEPLFTITFLNFFDVSLNFVSKQYKFFDDLQPMPNGRLRIWSLGGNTEQI
jgi:hypothetical protein